VLLHFFFSFSHEGGEDEEEETKGFAENNFFLC
jgi:hypothetical protein